MMWQQLALGVSPAVHISFTARLDLETITFWFQLHLRMLVLLFPNSTSKHLSNIIMWFGFYTVVEESYGLMGVSGLLHCFLVAYWMQCMAELMMEAMTRNPPAK